MLPYFVFGVELSFRIRWGLQEWWIKLPFGDHFYIALLGTSEVSFTPRIS